MKEGREARALKEKLAEDTLAAAQQSSSSHGGVTGEAADETAGTAGAGIIEHINTLMPLPLPAKRTRRAAARILDTNFVLNDPSLQDLLPVPLVAVADSDTAQAQSSPASIDHVSGNLFKSVFDTHSNAFGVFRRYTYCQSDSNSSRAFLEQHDPDSHTSLSAMSDIRDPDSSSNKSEVYAPFPNKSAFLLSDWFWNHGAQKSKDSFRQLLQIIGDNAFSPNDITGTNWQFIDKQLGINDFDKQLGINDWDLEEWQDGDAGWAELSVSISIPFHRFTDHPGPQNYTVNGFYHRSLVSVIREKLTLKKDDAKQFHLEPYQLLWQSREGQDPLPLYGEMYSSEAFLHAHRQLQESPAEPGCTLPRVVISLMFWSDATHLTQFGNAKITPLYLYFGNESKYRRCRPTCRLAEHVAFFQTLPDAFKDFANRWTGLKKVSPELVAHCKRELAHEQWRLLLDDEFLEAYEHGIVLDWVGDGQKRRFYPRVMTYSCDYPEKYEVLSRLLSPFLRPVLQSRALMATVRQLGGCPCPRCKIPKKMLHMVGNSTDRVARIESERWDDDDRRKRIAKSRSMIYGTNLAVDSTAVERELKPESLVPTIRFGFHWPSIFVVDLLHEIELGVVKALILHLLRILECVDENLIHELDRRFRAIPTFGRDTIRRFTNNASELKKMAAHNYEDLLQCFIPVFDGLLSDDAPSFLNRRILRVLFHITHWHALAKLRLHSSATLGLLDKQTSIVGDCLRDFQANICPLFATRELRREAVARERRSAARKAAKPQKGKGKEIFSEEASVIQPREGHVNDQEQVQEGGHETPVREAPAATLGQNKGSKALRKEKTFNLNTYKIHSMGDYVSAIKTFGTTDSYSTETGELEHRLPKSNYKRTSKKHFQRQLAQIERKQARLHRIGQAILAPESNLGAVAPHEMTLESESASEPSDPALRYHVGASQHIRKDIRVFIQENAGDPAINAHLLPRLKVLLKISNNDSEASADPRSPDRERMFFKNDALYQHNVLRINYTTYDVRRLQDVLNPRTDHRDIILLRQPWTPDKHEFQYARVLGIYHVNAIYHGPANRDLYTSHRLDFLWVRWFEIAEGYDHPASAGWSELHLGLEQLTFPSVANKTAFGFVDPADVIRGCHIIPKFHCLLRHIDGTGLSGIAQDKNDWNRYIVNRFVDRDMVMRFHWGLGVGHSSTYSGRSENHGTLEPGALDSLDADSSSGNIEPITSTTSDASPHFSSDDESDSDYSDSDETEESDGPDTYYGYDEDFTDMYGGFDDDEVHY
ncbi:hypothetical protein DXG01_016189 [Tephrocybe rancida]|nr:hypothetical protein DXG01_016189 [Tephrocybe rancida]